MNITTIPISKLNPAEYNPRVITKDEFSGLVESLKTFGQQENLIVNKDMTVISGHQRLEAMKSLGWEEAVCNVVDLDKHAEKKLNVIMNSHAISGKYDDILLGEILEELKLDDDYESLRLNVLEPLDLSTTEVEEDEAPEISQDPPVSKLGEIYQLGRHFVMCGDSTVKENVELLMNGVKADMVFTDPPYGMKKEKDGVLNDNLNYDDLLEFNKKWIPNSFNNLKDNGSWYCWGIDEPLMDIYSNILKPMQKENKITFRNLITWNKFHKQKPTMIGMMRSYCVYDEKCLFVQCGVQGTTLNSDQYFKEYDKVRIYLENEAKKVGLTSVKLKEICGVGMYSHWFTKSQFTLIPKEHYKKIQNYFNDGFKKEYEELRKEYEELRAYFDNTHETYMTAVWDFETTNGEERESAGEHATPKPLALCSRAIKSSTRSGETVLDVFLGSGSTLIACEQTDRTCYGMELDPKYVDVIRKRYAKFIGKEEQWQEVTPLVDPQS